jgi:hypothetical protein
VSLSSITVTALIFPSLCYESQLCNAINLPIHDLQIQNANKFLEKCSQGIVVSSNAVDIALAKALVIHWIYPSLCYESLVRKNDDLWSCRQKLTLSLLKEERGLESCWQKLTLSLLIEEWGLENGKLGDLGHAARGYCKC